ncbi:MAG TPA: GNAT family N-acetyltransferase [Streptosporangiaceae bacterium]|nr:GNAT family N-acetyltransferase [Streptosporangiaceae bacterium]
MEIRALDGLSIALVDTSEALETNWCALAGKVDVVRVLMPPRRRRAELADAGFLTKPARITWIAATRESEESFLSGLSFRDRKNIRVAQLRAASSGVRFETVKPVDQGLLTGFQRLYEGQVAGMRHGVAIATEQIASIADESAHFYAVAAYIGGELVGVCLAQECPTDDLVRLRFAATDPARHREGLSRALYFSAIQAARQMNYGQVSLGTDPNLYGHLVKAGLFAFKWRLGFAAMPSQAVLAGEGFDEADLIVGSAQLVEPVLFLSYADSPPELQGELYCSQDGLDIRPYQAEFLADVRLHRLGRTYAGIDSDL